MSAGVMVQAHRDALIKLLEGKVSVDPLSVAIQEFSLVAKEVTDEAKVFLLIDVYNLVLFFSSSSLIEQALSW